MKKTLVFVLLFSLQSAFAGCEEFYARKVTDLTIRMNPSLSTIAVNLGAEAVLITTLASAGVLTIGGVVALPATALASGGWYAYLAKVRGSYKKGLQTLKHAERKGPMFQKFVKDVRKKKSKADGEHIREVLLRLNAEQAFCKEDEMTGNIKIAKFGQMVKKVRNEL